MGDAVDFSPPTSEIAVIGAGLNGLAAAKAFAQAGFSVLSAGPLERSGPGRTVALFGPSLDLMEAFGLGEALRAEGAALRGLRIVDDTGSLFAPRPVDFHCDEIDLDAFGWNIENARLAELMVEALSSEPNLTRCEATIARLGWREEVATLTDSTGALSSARLVVAADGRNSPTRKRAGIEARLHPYPQSALTLFLRHTRPHDDVSTEFHTREGPFTLVPLPPVPGAPDRSSLVWLMSQAQASRRAELDDGALAREIERQSHGLIGRVEIEGGRGVFPMVRLNAAKLYGRRVALVGDAAHAYPPIGAQGLNLGLRDVQALVAAASEARAEGRDFGAAETLAAYARARAPDITMRTLAVNGLNVSLLANFAPVDALRGFGLTALSALAPLRKIVMREGVFPRLSGRAG